jgi:hypothetical protein
MEFHDFSEFYLICGPIMEAHIKNTIDYDIYNRDTKLIKENTRQCAKVLLELSDDKFEKIYHNVPSHIELFEHTTFRIIPSNDIHNQYIEPIENFTYYTFICACISNINLIRKCLKISVTLLNNSINMINSDIDGYINLDVESCKLLHEHGCCMNYFYYIATCLHNYDSMKCIVDNMNAIELTSLISTMHYLYGHLSFILIIDKISAINDKDLNALLKLKVSECYLHAHAAQCYYIIKYIPLSEGKELLIEHNKQYDACTLSNIKILTDEQKILYNNVLEFHFRPRGGHTKSALATFL